MKYFLNRNDKATGIQSMILIIINSIVLTVFNFGRVNTSDLKSICMATITVTIPLIMNVYKDKTKINIVKQNFDSLFSKVKFSLMGLLIIAIVIAFEIIFEIIMRIKMPISPVTIILLPILQIMNMLFHALKLYVSYFYLIIGFSIVFEPWIYTMLFYLDENYEKQ